MVLTPGQPDGDALSVEARVARAYQLMETGRADEALALVDAAAQAQDAGHAVLAARMVALKRLGRHDLALGDARRAVTRFPDDAVAWHNLAATLDDLARPEEALEAIERAFALGLQGAETWLVAAHAHYKLLDLNAAQAAFERALELRPGDVVAANGLSRLLWMRTGDWRQAVAPLRKARAAGAPERELIGIEAAILNSAQQTGEIAELVRVAQARAPQDPEVLCAVAHGALTAGDLDRAGAVIEAAVSANPNYAPALLEFAAIRMTQGRPEEAFEGARRATQLDRNDQAAWGWLATAGRALGHDVHDHLYDFDRFVRAYTIEAPRGWTSLEAYLADLAATLRRLHLMQVHPADQSLRNGTQTLRDLTQVDDPAIRAFFSAIDPPIRRYMSEIGSGPDPLRSRNLGGYRVTGCWSVLLQPNGFHVNHFHPMGWISSAFYVEVPHEALAAEGHEGWIKFGEPPFPVSPPQGPLHFVRPEPGRLVLFPSYMWHGTVPFTTAENRMSVAFDLLPVAP